MTAPLIITGSSTDASTPSGPALPDTAFTWLHLEGASYLRMPYGDVIDGTDVVVTVVGVADSGHAGWLVVG